MSTFNSKRFIAVIALIFCGTTVNAQFAATSGQTATDLVNYLSGLNVTVTNATMTCPSGESGIFTYSGSTLNMTDGVVLSTAPVSAIGAPVSNFVAAGSSAAGDADLANSIPGTPGTFDACILECDVIAAFDTLYLNYSFASEEYPEYACSQYNDAFRFFIQGNGFTQYTNFALVPNTSIATSINSVNMAPNGTFWNITTCNSLGTGSPFAQYYIDNQGQAGQDIVFDGLTTTLEAFIVVTTGLPYHLKFVVGNVSDGAFQSAVFMEGGSLSSKNGTTTSASKLSGNIPALKVYPNPSNESISLSIPSALANKQLEVSIADVVGKTVYTYSGAAGNLNKDLNAASRNFAPGVYALNLAVDGQQQLVKFQKN